jgi:hypothetical protein
MSTYITADQVRKAIDSNNRISGIVNVEFSNSFLFSGVENLDDVMTNGLIGEENGCFLEDINYSLTGCDVENQILFVMVDADAETLLDETNDLEDF